MSEDFDLSHNEVVAAITDVALPVVKVAGLSYDASVSDELPEQTKLAVQQVLKHRKLDGGSIIELADWPPIYKTASERVKLIFIALVLAIYN